MTLVAGIDASTQSCKVVVRDADTGELLRSGRAPHPDGTSVDPTRWWDALLAAVADAGGVEDVAAISIAGQQHGMVALDEHGHPVRDALLWNDVRSARAALDLTAELGATAWAQAVGSVPLTSYTASKLRWLRDHEPDNASRVAAVALPHDYLTWRLRGFGPGRPEFAELATDRSEASGTAYWSPGTDSYREDLLEHAFGARPILPRVYGHADVVGVTGQGLPGIPADVIVGAGAADNAAAALSFDADEGDVLMSLGTSGTVFAVAETPVADAAGVVSGFADASGRFLPLVSTFNAARILTAACRLLGSEHDELSALALSAPPGSNGLVHLPYLEGERTPNYPDATGALLGMTLRSTTPACLARAMVEGMLCGLAEGLDALIALRVPARRILLIGGGAKNAAVQQIAGEVFDVAVTVPPPLEYVATGAARQAAWALRGVMPSWPLHVGSPVAAAYRPEIRRAYAQAREQVGYVLTTPSPVT